MTMRFDAIYGTTRPGLPTIGESSAAISGVEIMPPLVMSVANFAANIAMRTAIAVNWTGIATENFNFPLKYKPA